MPDNLEKGLLALTDPVHQEAITTDLCLDFVELYDSLGLVRENARMLEDTMNRALYGTGAFPRYEYRSLRQRLLDPRG